uniref:Phospholipase B1, membrane-associated n=1 Tax=Plectus sambesii TaxID=2011161 RepID=A0A914VYS3_9BILA
MKTVLSFILAIVGVVSGDLKDLGYQNYNCPGLMGPSATVPTTAHSVRPADIKVVGALGDSLTAGNGADATTLNAVHSEYRGLSFPIGGDKGLENHVTVPNVLLKYNSKLFGQSHGIGTQNTWSVAQLNAAVAGATVSGLAAQAQDLVTKIQTHPQIDIKNDWKLIHIFIGSNDICIACLSKYHTPEIYETDLKAAIKILHDNLPRTIVSITSLFNMGILRIVDATEPQCAVYHGVECKCMKETTFDINAACKAYQAAQMDIQTSGIYDDRPDFTFVVQPFLVNTTQPPKTADGKIDLSFFAPDCFHFSQYGHAITAKALWNNMVQPIGAKTTVVNFSDPTTSLLCPASSCPFIRTTKNSANCAHYLTPAK